jgi:type I restriction enzyme S subunit
MIDAGGDVSERQRTFPKSVQPGIPRLGALKPGWRRVKIGNLFHVVSRPCQLDDAESYRLVTVKRSRGGIETRGDLLGAEIAVKSQFYLEEDDFLISKRQIVHGACAIVPAEFEGSIVSNEYAVLRCRDILDLGFLRQLIHSIYFQQTCFHSSIGVHVEKMIFSTPDWFEWEIDIPEIAEQRRIAGFFGAIDERITLLVRKAGALTQYKREAERRLFARDLRFRRSDGSNFSDWSERPISALGVTVGGLTGKSADDFGFGKPFVTYKQVFSSPVINISDCEQVDVKASERQNCLRRGDIIFTTSSEVPEEVAFASVLMDEVEELYLNSFCFALRPFAEADLDSEYARHLFRSALFRQLVYPLAQGSTRYNLSKSEFMKLRVPIPSREEQLRLANFLSALDDKIEAVRAKVLAMQAYKKGLLQQMFG